MTGLIIAAVVALLVVIMLARSVHRVHHGRAMVIERLGRFHSVREAGITVRIPFVDQIRSRVDLREQVITFPQILFSTADDKAIGAKLTVFCRVVDAKASTYNVSSWILAMEATVKSRLSDLICDLTREQNLRTRRVTEESLRADLSTEADRWGVLIVNARLELDPN